LSPLQVRPAPARRRPRRAPRAATSADGPAFFRRAFPERTRITAPRVGLALGSMAAKPNSLASNNKTGCRSSASPSAGRALHFAANRPSTRQPTMSRDDALFWLSVFWFVAFCGVAIWLLAVP
jgi:hypothetical protein